MYRAAAARDLKAYKKAAPENSDAALENKIRHGDYSSPIRSQSLCSSSWLL